MTTLEVAPVIDRTDTSVDTNSQIHEVFDAYYGVHELMYGDKILEVMIAEDNTAGTLINTIEGEAKIDGATTALYVRASQILQETADGRGKPVTYFFTTANSSMRRWAATHGAQLFNWSVVEDSDKEFTAQTVVNPRR